MARQTKAQDKQRLLVLLAALDAASSQLRKDGCSDWRIIGPKGHIYADQDGFLMYAGLGSARKWTAAKKLIQGQVTQNGDDEGCIAFVLPLAPQQAGHLRRILGLRKRRAYSDEALERMRINARENLSQQANQTKQTSRRLGD